MRGVIVRWAQALPLACLLLIALNQLRLVANEDLSPWSGGGFGMFSTTDDRHLHAYVLTPGLRRELKLPAALENALQRALALPGEGQLSTLAALLDQRLPAASKGTIEIQVWANSYRRSDLRPHGQLLRSYRAEHAANH